MLRSRRYRRVRRPRENQTATTRMRTTAMAIAPGNHMGVILLDAGGRSPARDRVEVPCSGIHMSAVDTAKDLGARLMTGFHEWVFRASDGRLLGRVAGMPVVMLTTTGRKSGKPRTTMLTSPVQEGERVVLVASYGGDDRHPAWFLNLRANPDVEVTMLGRRRAMRARVATAKEKQRLWPSIVQTYRGYEGYQRRTERDIPLVILEPATG